MRCQCSLAFLKYILISFTGRRWKILVFAQNNKQYWCRYNHHHNWINEEYGNWNWRCLDGKSNYFSFAWLDLVIGQRGSRWPLVSVLCVRTSRVLITWFWYLFCLEHHADKDEDEVLKILRDILLTYIIMIKYYNNILS